MNENEQVQPVENEIVDAPEENLTAEETSAEGNQGDNTNSENEELDPVKLAEVRAGKAIAAQRKKYQEDLIRLQRENDELKKKAGGSANENVDANEENQIYDPKTKRYFDINTPLGLQVWREQEAARVEWHEQSERVYQEAAAKILQGQARYKNYDVALENFQNHGTNAIADALIGAEDPAEIVNYLGSPGNAKELARLSSLPPHQVKWEVYRLQTALQGSKRKVSQASEPVQPVSEIRNTNKRVEDQTVDERTNYYRERFGRK